MDSDSGDDVFKHINRSGDEFLPVIDVSSSETEGVDSEIDRYSSNSVLSVGGNVRIHNARRSRFIKFE